MNEMLPLTELEAGQSGEIAQIVGRPDDIHRLEELGLRPGAVVEMVQPGVPCIIRLCGAKLCFRESDVFSVLVRAGVTV